MKALKLMVMVMILAGFISMVCAGAFAETRTLHTLITVTVKPLTPQIANAPATVQEALKTAFSDSKHDQFVRLDNSGVSGMNNPCYTMMEKL